MRIAAGSILLFGIVFLSACDQETPVYQDPYRYSRPVFDSVKVSRDIHYRTAETFSGQAIPLFFDFHEPYGDSLDQRPLIVLMHGGGFIEGHRGWMDSLAGIFPQYGYCCANISYRLYDAGSYPLNNEDFTTSFLLAREDLIEAVNFFAYLPDGDLRFRIDVDNIFIAGASAGAIGALHAIPINITESSNPVLLSIAEKMGDVPGPNLDGPVVYPRGILSFAGAVLDTTWITPEYPPVLLVHGTSDHIVPYAEGFIQITNIISPMAAFGSGSIYEKLMNMGSSAVLIPAEGAGHDNFLKQSELWKNRAIEFLHSAIRAPYQP